MKWVVMTYHTSKKQMYFRKDNLLGNNFSVAFQFHSFLISDNAVYEGTGWHIRGSHTYNYNSNSTGIGFIGDFSGK